MFPYMVHVDRGLRSYSTPIKHKGIVNSFFILTERNIWRVFFSLVCFILICSDIFLIPCQKDMKLHAGVLKLAASSWYTRGRTCSNYEYKDVASTTDHLLLLLLLSLWAWRVQTWAQLWSCPPRPLWGPNSSHNRLTTLLFKYIHFTWKTTAAPGGEKCAITGVF